ncbi:MAG: hypothetical protein AB1324_04515 [Candidatus Micrarchaeota archaeon]
MNPLLLASGASPRFALRRLSRKLNPAPKLDTLIVDVDRTLTTEDSPKAALERLCGKSEAKKLMDGFIRAAIKGDIPLDGLHGEVFRALYERGFKPSDWGALMEEFGRSGAFRTDLVDTIHQIAERERLRVVVATRSSLTGAQWIASRFGFGHAVGSVEYPHNGGFSGFRTVIGVRDNAVNGTRFMTKMSATAELLSQAGIPFSPSRAAVISNDLLDALEMLDSALGVLVVPRERNTLEKITLALRLYDVKIPVEDARYALPAVFGIEN